MSHWKPSLLAFNCFGLEFTADIKVYPGFEGNRESPPEGPELTFESLRYEGKDVSFMLQSETLLEQLTDSAWDQLNRDWEPDDYGPEDLE